MKGTFGEPIQVLKFGSSVLPDAEALNGVAHELYRKVRDGFRVIAVVSAIGGTTESLLRAAHLLSAQPEEEALARLLQTGEQASVASLSLVLSSLGVPNRCLSPAELGLETEGSRLDGTPCRVSTRALEEAFVGAPVLIVPGFVGQCAAGRPSLLGRGGSDLTAMFLADELGGECILYKDVDGIYEWDPARPGHEKPGRFKNVSWDRAIEIGGRVVQPKAVVFAKERQLSFEVTALGAGRCTKVGLGGEQLAVSLSPIRLARQPLRVALLGCGTVGEGVYQLLKEHPSSFTVTGILVRDIGKYSDRLPKELLTDDIEDIFRAENDLVIELVGGREPAAKWIARSLSSGLDVVTANKDVIANHGAWLRRLAHVNQCELLYSASVGGAVPMIELISSLTEAHQVTSFEGVLNGTTNFVIDRLAEGLSFADAVKEAQECGFAEADPSFDLNGMDVAHKLSILAYHAFGVELDPTQIDRRGIEALTQDEVSEAFSLGQTYRLIASCSLEEGRVKASIQPQTLPLSHPFAQTRDEHNRLSVRGDGQSVVVTGKGAGRWPTAASVFADVWQAWSGRVSASTNGHKQAGTNRCQAIV